MEPLQALRGSSWRGRGAPPGAGDQGRSWWPWCARPALRWRVSGPGGRPLALAQFLALPGRPGGPAQQLLASAAARQLWYRSHCMRVDLSEWIVHFVHRRNPSYQQYDEEEEGEILTQPLQYEKNKEPLYASEWDRYDEQYPIEPDAMPFSVLLKILHDGYIRAGWSIRNGKPTIYGPTPAVCFTEMPL